MQFLGIIVASITRFLFQVKLEGIFTSFLMGVYVHIPLAHKDAIPDYRGHIPIIIGSVTAILRAVAHDNKSKFCKGIKQLGGACEHRLFPFTQITGCLKLLQ